MVKTDIGYSTVDAIVVRGLNLSTEIIGHFDFVDMFFHTALNRRPTPSEKAMVNALLVTTADHGITPSSIAARLTYAGAPEAMQGAIAAGLLGAGSVFLGTMQNAAEMLYEAAKGLGQDASDDEIREAARSLVQREREQRRPIYGMGHPVHVNGDPRVEALRQLSKQHGYYGLHWRLMEAISAELARVRGKPLPMNAVGAIGSIIAAMNLDPVIARGLAVVGRAGGLVAHILEEKTAPVTKELCELVMRDDPRNQLPQASR